MKSLTRFIFIAIFLLVILFFILKRYYFLGAWNVHMSNCVEKYLDSHYGIDEYKTKEKDFKIERKDGYYLYSMKYTLMYNGTVFSVYQSKLGKSIWDGSFNEEDYAGGIRENYGRMMLEEKGLKNLHKYEIDFDIAVSENMPDYRFVLNNENKDEIKYLIHKIFAYSEGLTESIVSFDVVDINGKEITNDYDLFSDIVINNHSYDDIDKMIDSYIL